jgi:hypothetical protein
LTHFYLAERYLYVPSFGVCLLIALALDRLWRAASGSRHRVCTVAAGTTMSVLLLAGGMRSVARNGEWRDGLVLWGSAIRSGGDTYRAHWYLAQALFQTSRTNEANHHCHRAIALAPPTLRAELCERALRSFPLDRELVYLLAEHAWQSGNRRLAAARYTEVVALAPRHTLALAKLAWLRATSPEPELRNPVLAISLARRALETRSPPPAQLLHTLAVAQTAADSLPGALEAALLARKAALDEGHTSLVPRIDETLRVIRSRLAASAAR